MKYLVLHKDNVIARFDDIEKAKSFVEVVESTFPKRKYRLRIKKDHRLLMSAVKLLLYSGTLMLSAYTIYFILESIPRG